MTWNKIFLTTAIILVLIICYRLIDSNRVQVTDLDLSETVPSKAEPPKDEVSTSNIAPPEKVAPLKVVTHKNWIAEFPDTYKPTPEVNIKNGQITITGKMPPANNYPRVRLWNTGQKIPPNTPYVLETEARLDAPELMLNAFIGWNLKPGSGNNHSFHHWHLGIGGGTQDYQGDWSDNFCSSGVAVDDKFHTFKLVYDGKDKLDYYLDDILCTHNVMTHPVKKLKENEFGVATIYFERYPKFDPEGVIVKCGV